jgi:HTH-type transcriptional regulator/antitoxin HigA
MVDELKNEYFPDFVTTPGETLLEILQVNGISQIELSERTGRAHKTINEIIKGKGRITPEIALQLERVLNIPSNFWNNRQRRYDDYQARIEEEKNLSDCQEWAEHFPYKKMAELGWVKDVREKMGKLRNLLDFFGVVTPDAWDKYWGNVQISYRKSAAFSPDKYALAAWLRKGEMIAHKIHCEPFKTKKLRACLPKIRLLTVESPDICASCGVAVAFVRELPRTASGATRWITSQKALLQLSLRYKTDDHLWFTFFHEAGHILYGHERRKILIEDGKTNNENETKADKFATEFLIPKKDFAEFAKSGRFSIAAIREFAEYLGIAPGIVVGQLQKRNLLPWTHGNNLKKRFVWKN